MIGDSSTEYTIRHFGLGPYWYRLHGNLADRSLSNSSNTCQHKFQQPITRRCAESLKKKRGIQFQTMRSSQESMRVKSGESNTQEAVGEFVIESTNMQCCA